MPTADSSQRAPSRARDTSTPDPSAEDSPKRSAISAKSAAITAKNNYVSPYKQQPTPRSVSSPVRANPSNANAPNFKNIMTRFNTKSDEKIPMPTNRIPATTGPSAKSRNPQMWKANIVVEKRPEAGSKARASSAAPPTSRSKTTTSVRPASSRDSRDTLSGARSAAGSRQARSRRLSTSSNTSEVANHRLLPPLQTSFSKEVKGYRRSQSALDHHSPSAASMADNESDTSERKLHHRRSRSLIDPHASNGEIQLDEDLLRGIDKNPGAGRSTSNAISSPNTLQQTKKKTIAPPPTSAHGSRRPQQPSKSPQLSAYISAPPPKSSPQLRSSKGQRLAAASPTTPSRKSATQRDVKGKGKALEDNKKKEPKRNIPELGTIDFAARRARIQNAFTQSLKENNEQMAQKAAPKTSHRAIKEESEDERMDEHADLHADLHEDLHRHDHEGDHSEIAREDDAHVHEEEGKSAIEAEARFDRLAEEIMGKIPSSSEPFQNATEHQFEDVGPQHHESDGDAASVISETTEATEATQVTEETITEASPPRATKRFSQFFMPDQYPYTANKVGRNRLSSDASTRNAPVALVITPESPREPNLMHQVSNMLRTNSGEWSTDSEFGGESSLPQQPPGFKNNKYGKRYSVMPDAQYTSSPAEYEQPSLSPVVGTATSDDRRTIASVFSQYDDHGEDIVRSYAKVESTPSPVFRRDFERANDAEDDYALSRSYPTLVEDDTRSFTSCSEMVESVAPSSACGHSMAEETEDGWTTTSALSSDEDVRRRTQHTLESPTTPRQPAGSDSPRAPTPPPKDDKPPQVPAKDTKLHRTISPSTSFYTLPVTKSSFELGPGGSPSLPEIETDSEPLGLAIQALPSHFDFRPSSDRTSSYNSEYYYNGKPSMDDPGRSSIDSRRSMDQRPSMDQYSLNRPSLERPSLEQHDYSGPSSISDSRRSSMFASNGHRYSETTMPSLNASTMERGSSSIHSVDKDTPEKKMLRKRWHLLHEIVDTESVFFRDMTVAEEIYKGSANACYSLTAEDIKVLFANTDAIVQFSKGFLEVLRLATKPIFEQKRGSGLTSSAASMVDSIGSDHVELSDEDKDRLTYVGEAFAEMMYRMERVYGDYCKNHETAVARLKTLAQNPGVSIWLAECKACADDLTNAWNLDALLIKPVQRVLKYPLLLDSLLKCTPADHPDRLSLESAHKEMGFVAARINEMKKRKDMVEMIVGRKKNEAVIRHGITKVFTRRAQKIKESVGMAEEVVDETFNKLFESYNMHCAQVEVVARDIEIYVSGIQQHVEKFIAFTSAFRLYGSAVPTHHANVEEKWKRFDTAMKEISGTYLHDHKLRVKKHAIEPLEALLKLHESPQMIMSKRTNKATDYARYKAIKDRGDTPDKKTTDLAEAYVALNETLIEELPRLFILTKKLVEAVLANFIDLQAQWMNDWASKIKMTFMELQLPLSTDELVKEFARDFSLNESMVNKLSIVNGLPSTSLLLSPGVSGSTLTLEAFGTGDRRPKTADDTNLRERAMSLNSQSPTVASFGNINEQVTGERRHSGGAWSPLSPPGVGSASSSNLALPPLLGPNQRTRAVSAAQATRKPPASQLGPPPKRSYSNQTPEGQFFHSGERPSRGGYKASAPAPLTLHPHRSDSSDAPPSAAFSSAMPMDDDRDRAHSNPSSRAPSVSPGRSQSMRAPVARTMSDHHNHHQPPHTGRPPQVEKAIFVAASLYEFKLPSPRREAGFPYLNYVQGEIFDVIGIKGEIWLARNQDDPLGEIGWIWCKHFQKVTDH
ncbi:hypothetical protein BZA77DRAFT_239175 [Pyronema omphalodes]|nr:hypothetical protein BZA77DRAFT_239175 [Pyronema omphalodes]